MDLDRAQYSSRVAGVIVLYNPPQNILENIESYRSQIDILFAIDNSERPNPALEGQLGQSANVVYRRNGGNLGVAKALNTGAQMALDGGYEFLLMMDQDSIAAPTMVEQMLAHSTPDLSGKIGIVYPYHEYQNYDRPRESEAVVEIFLADTAGSLLNLEAYRKTGQFMDELFVDYVDFEYCLRLHEHGFRIVQVNNAMLHQRLGNLDSRTFLFQKIGVSNHKPIRIYYRIRNRLIVSARHFKPYPWWSMKEMILTVYVLVKILVFEKDRWQKTKMAFKGLVDFAKGRLGSYESNN